MSETLPHETRPVPPDPGQLDDDELGEFATHLAPSSKDDPAPSHDANFDGFATRMIGGRRTVRLRVQASDSGRRVGRYAVTGRLGEGGMGDVLQVVDDRIGREVALKRVKKSDRRAIGKFVLEAQITGQLEHPNIIPVYELGVTGDQPYLTMKRVEGKTLEDLLRHLAIVKLAPPGRPHPPGVPPTRQELIGVFIKMCDALRFAHANGVIHRDLKPANIMVGRFGEVLVMDWGLAKLVGDDSRETWTPSGGIRMVDPMITQDGSVVGTPSYMPPEQANGEIEKIDERSDVFALGAILYNILSLRRPYGGSNVIEILARAGKGRFRPPREAAPELEIPWELEAVVLKAMATRRNQRYQTVEELRDDVVRFVEGRMLSAAEYTFAQRVRKWVERHRMTAIAIACALITLVLAGSWGYTRWQRASQLADARTLAIDASARLEWATARDAANRALALDAGDEKMAAIARDSERVLAAIAARKQADLERAEFDRRVREAVAPVSKLIQEARPFFHIGQIDIRAKLRPLLRGVRELESFVRGPGEAHPVARGRLGAGLLLVGELDKALPHLARARDLLEDARWKHLRAERSWVRVQLARLYLQRAMVADLTRASGEDRARARPWLAQARALLESPTESASPVDALLAKAHHAVASGRHDDAARIATEGLAKHPATLEVADFWLIRAWAAWERRDGAPTAAIEACDKAIAWRPHDAWAHFLRAAFRWRWHLALEARGDSSTAGAAVEADLDRALSINAALAPAYLFRGMVKRKAKKIREAIADYDRAIELAPKSAMAHYNRGNARIAAGDLAGAIDDYDEALRRLPGYWRALVNRGYANFRRKDLGAASDDYRKAVELAPQAWEPRQGQAQVLVRQGKIDAAKAALRAAISRAPAKQKPALERELRRLDR